MSNLRQRKKIPRKLVDNEHVYVQDFFNIPQSKKKTDVDNDHSAAKGTAADPQINSDEVVEETVWETAV